jgi:hypothetical protein
VLNKPVGITCTTEHKVKGNIVDFWPCIFGFQNT